MENNIHLKKKKFDEIIESDTPKVKIQKFPVILLYRILRYLEIKEFTGFMILSKGFREALHYFYAISEELDLSVFKFVNTNCLMYILPLCHKLVNLTISYEYLEANQRLAKIIEKCEFKLETLNLYRVNLSRYKVNFLTFLGYFQKTLNSLSLIIIPTEKYEIELTEIINVYPNLSTFKYYFDLSETFEELNENLWFRRMHIDFRKIKSKSLKNIELTNFFKYDDTIPLDIESLHLFYNEYAYYKNDSDLKNIYFTILKMKKLKNFGYFTRHSSYHYKDMINNELLSNLSNSENLFENLQLSVYCKSQACQNKALNDMNFMHFSGKHYKTLISLKLDSFKNITDASIIQFSNICNKLAEISLDYSAISDESIYAISENLQNTLKILSIKGCNLMNEDCLEMLFARCKLLKKIDLTCVHRVSDFTLFAAFLYGKTLESITLVQNDISDLGMKLLFLMYALREIKISEANISDKIWNLPYEVKYYIKENLHETFENLELNYEKNISLFNTCIPYLQILYLNETKVTDKTLQFVIENCKRLSKISINKCKVSSEVIMIMCKKMSKFLTYLSATDIKTVKMKSTCQNICKDNKINLKI